MNFNDFLLLCFKEKFIRFDKEDYNEKEFELESNKDGSYEPLGFI